MAQPQQAFQVLRGDAARQVSRLGPQSFDYIYFDPPYASDLYEPVLQAIASGKILRPGGVLIVEHQGGRSLPECITRDDPTALRQYRQKAYGRTLLSFYGASGASNLNL